MVSLDADFAPGPNKANVIINSQVDGDIDLAEVKKVLPSMGYSDLGIVCDVTKSPRGFPSDNLLIATRTEISIDKPWVWGSISYRVGGGIIVNDNLKVIHLSRMTEGNTEPTVAPTADLIVDTLIGGPSAAIALLTVGNCNPYAINSLCTINSDRDWQSSYIDTWRRSENLFYQTDHLVTGDIIVFPNGDRLVAVGYPTYLADGTVLYVAKFKPPERTVDVKSGYSINPKITRNLAVIDAVKTMSDIDPGREIIYDDLVAHIQNTLGIVETLAKGMVDQAKSDDAILFDRASS